MCTIRAGRAGLAGCPVGDQRSGTWSETSPAIRQGGLLEVLAAAEAAPRGLHCLGSAMACSKQNRAEDFADA